MGPVSRGGPGSPHMSSTDFPVTSVLTAGEVIDDQPGSCPYFHKAYGPFESMKLRQRDSRLARLNNENYVWYALVSRSLYQFHGARH